MKKTYFTPEIFTFLRQLKRNNNKQWFEKNKSRYFEVIRDPFLEFIADFSPELKKINPYYLSIPRPVGGSLFRIYRDVRFSNNKTPYKTHAAAQFNHTDGKNVHAPGFYLHLEPGNVFAGAGIWKPDSKTLNKIRQKMVDEPAKWKRAIGGKLIKSMGTLEGDKLSRPPRGFDPDHPLVEYLKMKDILVLLPLSEKDVCSPDFMARFTRCCRASWPLVKFITEAIGLKV